MEDYISWLGEGYVDQHTCELTKHKQNNDIDIYGNSIWLRKERAFIKYKLFYYKIGVTSEYRIYLQWVVSQFSYLL